MDITDACSATAHRMSMECDVQYDAALTAVSAVFGSIGRVFICLDDDFRVVHASTLLRRLIGQDLAGALSGQPVSDLLGADLFGPAGTLRQLLRRGEIREGWRAAIHTSDGSVRVVSLTVLPVWMHSRMSCARASSLRR